MAERKAVKLAVLLSGGGTTLQNLIDRIADGTLNAEIAVVVSSRESAGGIGRARAADIETACVPSRDYGKDWSAMAEGVYEVIDAYEPDLVALAGYMCYIPVAAKYEGRMMNIHPALLPLFGGEGFYGRRVHEAVLKAGVKVSGCSVHFADNRYDCGPIIIQKTVPVLEDDTPDALAARVFEQECIAYPEAIGLFSEGRLAIEGRRVRILPGETRGSAELTAGSGA